MKTIRYTIIALIAFMFVAGASHAEALYGTATGLGEGFGESSLYMINPDTGEATLIGPIGFDNVTAMAFLGDGRLVGSANGDNDFGSQTSLLIEIDKTTGAGSLIGIIGQSFNGECGRVPGLTYDPNRNILYGYGDACDGNDLLLTINTQTGKGTIIGPTRFSSGGNGLAWDPRSGRLFATPADDNTLVLINPVTALGRSITPSGVVPDMMRSLAIQPPTYVLYGALKDRDSVFGAENLSYLTTIDMVTGATTVVGESVLGLDGLIFEPGPFFVPEFPIPTLSEWGLIAMAGVLGIIGLLAIRRRKATV